MITALQENIILDALNEDLKPGGDLTTDCLIPEDHTSTYDLVINEDAILAGFNVFKDTFLLLDKKVSIESNFKDGDKIFKNQIIASVHGNTREILKAERTALNFISHLSGIATLTGELVEIIKKTNKNVILKDTRKTTPKLRIFEKQAVLAGGGANHRFNLSEMILIKDNHLIAAGGVKRAVEKARETYKNKNIEVEVEVEVEVETFEELKDAIDSKADIIMFDNWNVLDLKAALKLLPGGVQSEVSGQITKENITDYAELGVDFISTSYMIKNAKWIDFSLNAKKL